MEVIRQYQRLSITCRTASVKSCKVSFFFSRKIVEGKKYNKKTNRRGFKHVRSLKTNELPRGRNIYISIYVLLGVTLSFGVPTFIFYPHIFSYLNISTAAVIMCAPTFLHFIQFFFAFDVASALSFTLLCCYQCRFRHHCRLLQHG